jgi:guanylate kinase
MDIKGVQQVKAHSFPAKFIFLAPPSMECLESRLRRRGTDSEEQIVLRLSNAVGEMTFGTAENNFDEVIVNDELEVAYEEVLRHLREWFPVVGL